MNLSSKCYGVDTWLGDSQAGFYDSDVYESLSKYVDEHYQESAILMKCTFDDALNTFEDHSIDLLHIDGLHDYDSVLSDFKKWKRKLSNFSVILFHDTQVGYDGYGVQKLWKEIKNEFLNFEFIHCNGLGVILFGDKPNKSIINMFQYLKSHPQYIRLLQLMGAQIYYRSYSIELEKRNNEILNLTYQYSNSTSYKLGKLVLEPFKMFKKI
jgi:hypothetical protein